MLWAAYICFLIHNLNYLVSDKERTSLVDFLPNSSSKTIKMFLSLGSLLYLLQHWVFAMSYIRVAVIFKLVFSFHNVKIAAELERRKVYIFAFSIGVPVLYSLSFLMVAIMSPDSYAIADSVT